MKEPRIHYHNASFGTPTPCGITPSYRRPTKTVRNWLQVDCAECLASTRSSSTPARHGQPWDYESDSRLIRFLKGGFSVAEIAAELQRSEVSIECRITFLAYKEERATLLAAGIAKLTAEPKAPRKAAKRKKVKGRK